MLILRLPGDEARNAYGAGGAVGKMLEASRRTIRTWFVGRAVMGPRQAG